MRDQIITALLLCSLPASIVAEQQKLSPPKGLPSVQICAPAEAIWARLKAELQPRGFEVSESSATSLTMSREMSGWDAHYLHIPMGLYFKILPWEQYVFTMTTNDGCTTLTVDGVLEYDMPVPLSRGVQKKLEKEKWWRAGIQHELEKLKKSLEDN